MNRKTIFLKTAFLLAFLIVGTLTAGAYTCEVDGIYYDIYGNTAHVTVSPSNNYSDSIVIPKTITYEDEIYPVATIDARAFEQCTGLKSITIPNSVNRIEASAFNSCTGLKTVTIEDGTEKLALAPSNYTGPFTDCPIETLYLGRDFDQSYPYITEPFSGLTTLKSVTFGDYVESVKGFGGCVELTDVTLGDAVKTIEGSTFSGCTGLKSIDIPNSVTFIGESAFAGCSGLKCITIGESVEVIWELAFDGCTSLTELHWNAINCQVLFSWIRLQTVNLTNITIGNAVQFLGGGIGDDSKITSISIPNSVTTIDGAFCGCAGLTSVAIPSSVSHLEYAFTGCPNVTSINVEDGNSTYDSRYFCNAVIEKATNKLVLGCKSTTIPNSVTTIGSGAFSGCAGLTSVTIPNSVTTIGPSAFYCSGLTSIDIPYSVTTIGDGAFYGCSELTSVDIGKSVTGIGMRAFSGCEKLTSVICRAVVPPTIYDDTYDYDYSYARTLWVPARSIDAYCQDVGDGPYYRWFWSFGVILPIEPIFGDVDGDGHVSIADVTDLIDLLLNGGEAPAADVDGDGHVTVADVTEIIDMLLSGN